MMITEEEAKAKEGVITGANQHGGIFTCVNTTRKRKKKSESTMKGGRCSRINGRGWQCKKTTLAGYALCEYHLALARSRTMESKLS
ncbi:hypothetical protein ACHQM5_010655 [Ranunculus cassubicifolius]